MNHMTDDTRQSRESEETMPSGDDLLFSEEELLEEELFSEEE